MPDYYHQARLKSPSFWEEPSTGPDVIYHESHDQAGNASYSEGDRVVHSARTGQTAVNGKLDGNRDWAEARCRVVSGLTLLAPGVPMFFMGEELGAKEPYRYNDCPCRLSDDGHVPVAGRHPKPFTELNFLIWIVGIWRHMSI
ncbi:MAG: hypothetical protein WBL39_22685, partial [Terrimicrobiaceae bacterium]